jgi:hypothetical protein
LVDKDSTDLVGVGSDGRNCQIGGRETKELSESDFNTSRGSRGRSRSYDSVISAVAAISTAVSIITVVVGAVVSSSVASTVATLALKIVKSNLTCSVR